MATGIKRLLDIMQALRDPDTGCPWDVQQDFSSIAPYTIEEAYEVADAIQRGNTQDLKEELGDLLLQVVFHSQIASEQELFNFSDVVDTISEKMLRRHPHVFADEQISNAEDQTRRWEEHKATERAAKQNTSASVLASVPINFPGLLRAQKLSKKAASVGFDWPDIESVFGKVQEEILELTQAINHKDQSAISEEIGDLLFAISNIARKQNVDAESALQDASHKFTRRFRFIETKLHKQGMTVEDASLHEMEELWQQAKRINPI